jgi:hypothetical protein
MNEDNLQDVSQKQSAAMKPPLSSSARTVLDCFADNPVWGQLLPTLERLARLQDDVSACLPDTIKRRVKVVNLADDILALAVGSAALATKLRQTVPRIEAGLVARGWKVNAIQIRVQPETNSFISKSYQKKAKSAVVSSQASRSLAVLGEQLDDGPLKDAIARLASR